MAVTEPRTREVHGLGRRCREIVRTDDAAFPAEVITGTPVVGAVAGGGRLLLVTAAVGVQRIFAITGLDQVIASFTSLEAALASACAGAERG